MEFDSGRWWVEFDIKSTLTMQSHGTDVRGPLELKLYFWPRTIFHFEHGVWVSTAIATMSWDFISNTVCDSLFDYFLTKHLVRVFTRYRVWVDNLCSGRSFVTHHRFKCISDIEPACGSKSKFYIRHRYRNEIDTCLWIHTLQSKWNGIW